MNVITRGKGRPRQIESGAIDRAIRDAALNNLLEQGEGTTMNAIAVAAGLSRKSLYARFRNKTELFLEVTRDLLAGVSGLDYDDVGSAEKRLLAYVTSALEVIERPEAQAMQRLLSFDSHFLAALRPDLIAVSYKLFHEPLARLLSDAKARGEFAIEDVDAATLMVVRLIFAERMAIGSNGPPVDRCEYASFITRVITRGLLIR